MYTQLLGKLKYLAGHLVYAIAFIAGKLGTWQDEEGE